MNNCPNCDRPLKTDHCVCGWHKEEKKEVPKEKPRALCIKPGCAREWRIDRFCYEHYDEKERMRNDFLKVKRRTN